MTSCLQKWIRRLPSNQDQPDHPAYDSPPSDLGGVAADSARRTRAAANYGRSGRKALTKWNGVVVSLGDHPTSSTAAQITQIRDSTGGAVGHR